VRHPHIGLLGNPNSGKTSLFNAMTGLNQQVGNFPGVTVDKKTGMSTLKKTGGYRLTDLPGSYSLFPRREDEWVSYRALLDAAEDEFFDLYIVVVDASVLQRNLLYLSQVLDLGKPLIVALTMTDICNIHGYRIDASRLSMVLGVPVVCVNPRRGFGMDEMDRVLALYNFGGGIEEKRSSFFEENELVTSAIKEVQGIYKDMRPYTAVHYLINHSRFKLTAEIHQGIKQINEKYALNHTQIQGADISSRYRKISGVVDAVVTKELIVKKERGWSERLDGIFLHRFWGTWVMLAVLFLMFQAVFWLADYPMSMIEGGFVLVSAWFSNMLPTGWFSDLLIDGVVAGLGGILVFVPQIMILFGMITFFEDTGYMARISFLTDRFMRKVGLNGKSVMPMISGFACAVPAIMSARNIENKKERLLTILTTPLMSCSARIPVYTILISLVIPKKLIFGVINLQGLVMLGLYMLGFVLALVLSAIFHVLIRLDEESFFILELPLFRVPRWKNIFITMIQKARIFVFDAGKVIMIISLLLWALSSFGPKKERDLIYETYEKNITLFPDSISHYEGVRNALLLESSWIGYLGKSIEPLISPLGFDWKIGIALITSFAAREVFVGTMATLYSVGDTNEEGTRLRDKMQAAVTVDGGPVYTLATGVSLMVFYVLAMQCMSTLAVVKRETGTWKWPTLQFVYMTLLAYVCSLLSYILLS